MTTLLRSILPLLASLSIAGTLPAQAMLWQAFDSSVTHVETPSSELVLIAITNDLDQPRPADPAASIDFWARGLVESSLTVVFRARVDLAKVVRLEVARLGLPPALSGGRNLNRPERLMLVICDDNYRLLNVSVGLPDANHLQTLVEDAYETRSALLEPTMDRQQVAALLGRRSLERVNHFYAERLAIVLPKLSPLNSELGPAPAHNDDTETEEEHSVAPEHGKDGWPKDGLRKELPGPQALASETVTAAEPEIAEWENPTRDEAWKDNVVAMQVDIRTDDIAEAQLDARLRLIEAAFSQLYAIDARSRFASHDSLSTTALAIVEQHTEARAMWCDCVEPVLVGLDFKKLWRPFVQQTWGLPVVRHENVDADLAQWLASQPEKMTFALTLPTFPASVSLTESPVDAPTTETRRTQLSVTWADFETVVQELPTQTPSLDQIAALQRTGDLRALDLFQPDLATHLITTRTSRSPLIVRRSDSPAKHLSKIRRWSKQNRAAVKKSTPGDPEIE